MGNIVKLQNAGESVTWQIAKAETAAGNFGPQVKFESTNGEILYLPADSAERQLSRIPLSVAECVGETLVISRDANPKPGAKPYWGIKVAGIADKQATQPSKRLSYTEAAKPASGPSIGRIPEMDDFPSEEYGASIHAPDSPYDEPGPIPPFHKSGQTGTYQSAAVPVAPVAQEKAKVVRAYLDLFAWMRTQPEMKDIPADVVQSASATVWIEWNKRGLVK